MSKLVIDIHYRDAFSESDHPRDEEGKFTVTGKGRHLAALQQAAAQLPSHHYHIAGQPSIYHTTGTAGAGIQGNARFESGMKPMIRVGEHTLQGGKPVPLRDPIGTNGP